MMEKGNNLKAKRIGINTYRENVIYMRNDCPVCISEGFKALTRLLVTCKGKQIIATLNVINDSALLNIDEAGFSDEAIKNLEASDGELVHVSHLPAVASLGKVRAKMYGEKLTESDFNEIVTDIVSKKYSNVELAAFITACAGDNLDIPEIAGLTKAMINTGHRIKWDRDIILDKHSVGGLPGNRTTPIIVSIVAAAGLLIPKTSSRAITSPAGTADVMEVFTTVNLTKDKMHEVVEQTGGCLTWGESVMLSPADDILIAIEKSLDIDSEGQMIASVLSKKVAAGSTHVLIDIPVGPTAKVRKHEDALKLQYYFKAVSELIGLHTEVIISDGTQPVGRGIGPSLEAMDILDVLTNKHEAPSDLKEKSVQLAGKLLELSGKFMVNTGKELALQLLENGTAYKKFREICLAQGDFKMPVYGEYSFDVKAKKSGIVSGIDNRRLARIAKLAGAPFEPSAGIKFFAPVGKKITEGDVLFTIYAEAKGELRYAIEYYNTLTDVVTIE